MVVEEWFSLNLQNYQNYINQIIHSRGQFSVKDEYYEVHHIIPRAFGGEPTQITHRSQDSNLIWLTYKEHYTAHKILALDNMNNYKVVYAYKMMSSRIGEDVTHASEELHVSHSNLSQVCRGNRKSCGGLRFRYKDEN